MATNDYTALYHLGDVLKARNSRITNRGFAKALESAMSVPVEGDGFRIHRRTQRDTLTLSTDSYCVSGSNVLVASATKDKGTSRAERRPMIVLTYGLYDEEEYEYWDGEVEEYRLRDERVLEIQYVQTLRDDSRRKCIAYEDYQVLQETLGVRPHELLVAQYLARIAPVLDAFPATSVIVGEGYRDYALMRPIRDRFFDKKWDLNPNKERTRQALGPDNKWIQARQ